MKGGKLLKRTSLCFFALLLLVALVLPSFSSVCLAVYTLEPLESNPFEYYDNLRRASFSGSLSSQSQFSTKPSFTATSFQNENGFPKYIVRFKDSVSLNEIFNAIKSYPFTLLAQSEERIFSLELKQPELFKSLNNDIIEIFEADSKKILCATINDPLSSNQWELDALGLYKAWDITVGKPEVIVAILDSGINKKHSDLQAANILNGYDAVERTPGVDRDYNGHGTKIASIIAAVQNNSIGISGMSPGVTILPIRLLSENGYIYSSDFINAVYYAADAGAAVINMSFGGYTYSALEEEAVRYAHGKGCILTAASGNEGNVADKAGLKAYPASYDKVISVGAVYSDGTVCEFSQYNDSVDLVAPGADITVASQSNRFVTEIGTSFATAYISAVAALARSAITESASLNSDEFLSLVIKLNGKKRNDRSGYGFIDAFRLLENVNIPIVTGVTGGNIYHENITITYNRGNATLDGKPFKSGDKVIVSGLHRLEVKDGNVTVAYSFTTDNLPLQYSYKQKDTYSYFTFSRGTATVDGVPYLSGDKITTDGTHTFELKGPYGNSKTHVFKTDFTAPKIFGISDGATYDSPVSVSFVGSGNVYLNGQKMSNSFSVDQNGIHTVTVESELGLDKKSYTFTLDVAETVEFSSALANAKLIADEKYGTVMFYNDVLTGIRVHLKKSPAKMNHFVNTGKAVRGYFFYSDQLLLCHGDSISVWDRKLLSEGSQAKINTVYLQGEAVAYDFNGDELFYTVYENEGYSVYKTNILNGESELVLSTGLTLSALCLQENYFCVSNGKKLFMYSKSGEKLCELRLNKPLSKLVANEGLVFTGCELFDLSAPQNPRIILSISDSELPIQLNSEILITLESVYDVSTGFKLGALGQNLCDLFVSEKGTVYKSYIDKSNSFKENGNNALSKKNILKSLDATKYEEPFVSQGGEISPFTHALYLSFDAINIKPVVNNFKNEIYIISERERSLFVLDLTSLSLKRTVRFRYTPCSVAAFESTVIVGFSGTNVVYTLNSSYGDSYQYLPVYASRLSVTKETVFILSDEGKLYRSNTKNISDLSEVFFDGRVLSFITDDKYIYVLCKTDAEKKLFQLSLSDGQTVAQTSTKDLCETLSQSDTMVHLGTKAFSKFEGLALKYTTADEILDAHGEVILTNKGLHRASNGFTVSLFNTNGENFAFDSNYSLFSSDMRTLWKISANGSPLVKQSITGIKDGELSVGTASINFSYGKGFLDLKPYSNGAIISEGGTHTFTLLLPYGITQSLGFSLDAVLSGISMSLSNETIGINETAKITVSFIPHSAGTPEVVYSTDNDNITVSDDGTVTGLRVGKTLITATSVDGAFSTTATVTVVASFLRFDSSYFKVERDDGFVKVSVAGTTLDTLTQATSKSAGTVKVFALDGKPLKDGKLGTGMTVLLENARGEAVDSLTLSVKGDLDGDGYITVGDLAILCDHFSKQTNLNAPELYAADIDSSGKVDEVDLLCLKNHVLKSELINGSNELPSATSDGVAKITAPHSVNPGDEFEISFTITNAEGITSISSLLVYDPLKLALKQVAVHESNGWETDYDDIANGFISFLGHGSAIKRSRTLVTVTFIASTELATTDSLEICATETVACANGGAKVNDSQAIIVTDGSSAFEINIPNADSFDFDFDVYEYELYFPSDVTRIDLNCYPKESAKIEGDLDFSSGDEIEFNVIYTNYNGEKLKYNFKAIRDEGGESSGSPSGKSGNANLYDLIPSVGTLSPDFSSYVNNYYLFIPYDYGELSFLCQPDNSGCSVEINEPATYKVGEDNVVIIECTAEDGTKELYTITVRRAAETESVDTSAFQPPEKSRSAFWIVLLVFASVSAVVVILFAVLRKRT